MKAKNSLHLYHHLFAQRLFERIHLCDNKSPKWDQASQFMQRQDFFNILIASKF